MRAEVENPPQFTETEWIVYTEHVNSQPPKVIKFVMVLFCLFVCLFVLWINGQILARADSCFVGVNTTCCLEFE